MKSQIILHISKLMGGNRNQNRNENNIIRMGSKAREFLGLSNDKTVELYPEIDDIERRLEYSRTLNIFKAYTEDLKSLKNRGISNEDILRCGFVTKCTFNSICCSPNEKNIWLADTIEDTVIGGDPEFVVTDSNGNIIPGNNFNNVYNYTSFGIDGNGILMEIRPKPSTTSAGFINNIHTLLKDNVDKTGNHRWTSGVFFHPHYAVGGHIHIGTPLTVVKDMEKNEQFKVSTHTAITKVLEEYVSVPMMRVEGVDVSVTRREYYGGYGAYRVKGYVGSRLEYRSLSGHLLSHPKLAKCVVGTVKAITHAVFKDIECNSSIVANKSLQYLSKAFSSNDTNWGEFELCKKYDTLKSNTDMYAILHKGKGFDDPKPMVKDVQNKLKNISTYNQYKDDIDIFSEIIALPNAKLLEQSNDIKKNWLEGQNFII